MLKRVKVNGLVLALIAVPLLAAGCGARGPRQARVTPVPTIPAAEQHLRVFEAAWTAVRDQYVRDDIHGLDWDALGQEHRGRIEAGLTEDEFAANLRALLANLPDRQATYETRAERLEQETTDPRVYHGIGAFVAYREAPEPHVVILSVISDSPAERAGLQAHDSLYAVDGAPIRPEDAEAPAERIRGEPDSSVVLTVQSPGRPRREVRLQREPIRAADVLRGGFIESLGVVYYRVPVAAEGDLAQLIAQNLDGIDPAAGLQGIIVDLRVARSGNGSWPLEQMLSLFGDGALGEFYTRSAANSLTVSGQDVGGSQSLPLVLLVGPDTAGSPEIFAAALQSAGRALVVGLPTAGTVEGFTAVPLPDGSRLFLATSSFRTSGNQDLADRGLTPDLRLTADWDEITNEADPALQAALSVLLEGN
jgi:carboxyl-terminal processing protease